jgi:hypothetical protein
MINNIWAHPKTTLSGIGLAVLQVILNGRSGKAVLVAALMAALGALSQDPTTPAQK